MLTAVHVHVHVIEHVNIEVYMYTVQYDVVTSSANFVQVHIQASVLLCKITFRFVDCSKLWICFSSKNRQHQIDYCQISSWTQCVHTFLCMTIEYYRHFKGDKLLTSLDQIMMLTCHYSYVESNLTCSPTFCIKLHKCKNNTIYHHVVIQLANITAWLCDTQDINSNVHPEIVIIR